MKNLITVIACTLILLGFVSQFFANQMTHSRMAAIESEVYTFQGQVRRDGGLNYANTMDLKRRLAHILKCDTSKIDVNGSMAAMPRGYPIFFEVSIPKKEVFVAVKLWNLDSALSGDVSIRRTTLSERLDRSLQ